MGCVALVGVHMLSDRTIELIPHGHGTQDPVAFNLLIFDLRVLTTEDTLNCVPIVINHLF